MVEIPDDLKQVGAVLASAAYDDQVAFTDDQRETLARATLGETLDAIAIALNNGSHPIRRITQDQRDQIAEIWENELKAVFHAYWTPDRIGTILESGNPEEAMLEAILACRHLTDHEQEYFMNKLSESVASSIFSSPETESAYLTRIVVCGFRGIGHEAKLTFESGPGLTLVYGANGSGKSSFVEALDVLLTGSTPRFDNRGPEWRSAWQNAHRSNASGGGHVKASFKVSATSGPHEIDLKRRWSTTDEHDIVLYDTDNHAIDSQLLKFGWSDARDVFRPILGYAELGPLFDEDDRLIEERETPLARHLRHRLNISLDLAQQLWPSDSTLEQIPDLYDIINDWYNEAITPVLLSEMLDMMGDRERREMWALEQELLSQVAKERDFLPPSSWDWKKSVHQREKGLASVYMHNHSVSAQERAWSSKIAIYCEILALAIYNAYFNRLSRQVMDLWKTIRPGTALHFGGIKLDIEMSSSRHKVPTFRVSLSFSIEDGQELERGVLSQGEMHSLALSVFLPLMMQDQSPFGFAVIDDPVQVMDTDAVHGLAEVLDDVAENLQVIVFTHDERLVNALNDLGIAHKLIYITRTEDSRVVCERLDQPIVTYIADARTIANSVSAGHPRMGDWYNIGSLCRQAIEAACVEAVRQRLISKDDSDDDADQDDSNQMTLDSERVAREIDWVLEKPNRTISHLLYWAAFDEFHDLEKVRKHLKSLMKKDLMEAWMPEVYEVVNTLNGLVHGNDDEATRTASRFQDDLNQFIDRVETAMQQIRENCTREQVERRKEELRKEEQRTKESTDD